jgi:hypothetical protein
LARILVIVNRVLGSIATASGIYFLSVALIYRGGDYHGVTIGVVFIATGIFGLIGRLPRGHAREWGLVLLLALGAMSLLSLWVAWESWRAHTLLEFCNEAKVGMSVQDLLRLERQHWIDDSYLVEARFPDFVDQAHSLNLGFRSHMYDPDFECAIGHNGTVVTAVQLLK